MAGRVQSFPSMSRRRLFRLWLSEKHDPEPFYRAMADRTVDELSFALAGTRVLDLGCGFGQLTDALRRAGAEVAPVDLHLDDQATPSSLRGAARADGTSLPFPDGTFDGVMCSNLLEHTPTAGPVFDEIERVLVTGGWAWVSWTNWFSPWGGHEIVPFHYLGPRLGLRAWRRVFGEPRKNVPFEELWPTHVGPTLRLVRRRPGLRLIDAVPRYYPSQRWILKVPGLRELATWNCVLVLRRVRT